jgi:signal transduction histidine kinase
MKFNFSITPRILSHLGEDLIKNESIALFELIKNSYDACANHCIVDFIFVENKLTKLIIEDDGFGMNKETVEKVWLVVGTDNKKKNLEPNICGRIPLGEKGIGRLGIHKLGNKIGLVSKTKANDEIEIKIDWKLLENAKTIDDFPIEINEFTTPKTFVSSIGTRITIEDLKTDWDRRQLREVFRNITSLNSPFTDVSDSFSVIATSNNNVFEGLPNFDDIKNSALYFGKCKMEGNQIIDFTYEFKPWSNLEKIERGRIVRLDNLIEQDKKITKVKSEKYDQVEEIDLNKSKIGPIEFEIIIFDTDAQIFSYLNTEKSTLKTYLKDNGGIRVYRDGIRVYNYGERDNDWLGIDLKRVSRVGGRVSNNIIIGSVKINRSQSIGLIEKTNREGFIENETYFNFVSAVDYALSLFVRERNIDKEHLTSLYKKHRSIEPVLSDLNAVISLVEEKAQPQEVKFEILKYLFRVNEQYREVKEILIKSANAGLNLGIVIHELEKLISELTGCVERNEKEKAIRISLSVEKIIRGYSAMLKKSDIKINSLNKIVSIALDNYEFRFLDHSISVFSNWRSSKLQAYLAESESISILTNLLDNSIYWLKYARKENRMISIFITDQIKGYNSIIISDNGPGFNLPFDVAIKPFLSGKPHNLGSGLGLHVSNEMMTAMKGKLILITDENDIDFPKVVKENMINKAIIALCFPLEKK